MRRGESAKVILTQTSAGYFVETQHASAFSRTPTDTEISFQNAKLCAKIEIEAFSPLAWSFRAARLTSVWNGYRPICPAVKAIDRATTVAARAPIPRE